MQRFQPTAVKCELRSVVRIRDQWSLGSAAGSAVLIRGSFFNLVQLMR